MSISVTKLVCYTILTLLLAANTSIYSIELAKRDNGSGASITSSSSSSTSSQTSPPSSTPCVLSKNSTCSNVTSHPTGYRHIIDQIQKNKGMLLRTLYVLIGVTTVVVIYFAVKAVRLRRRRSKSKKYGIITSQASDLEMAPLDQGDDDDEDMTVFELNGKPK